MTEESSGIACIATQAQRLNFAKGICVQKENKLIMVQMINPT